MNLPDRAADRRRPRSAALLLAAAALSACSVSVSYTQTNSPPRAMQPKAGDKVETFLSGPPSRPFVEVGRLEAKQESSLGGDSMELLDALREEAGRQGCDAVVITGSSDKVVGAGSSGSMGVATLKGYRALCILFTE